jgi:hypothetical protein
MKEENEFLKIDIASPIDYMSGYVDGQKSTGDLWRKFLEWTNSKVGWKYDPDVEYWRGTPYDLPSTDDLFDIWQDEIQQHKFSQNKV